MIDRHGYQAKLGVGAVEAVEVQVQVSRAAAARVAPPPTALACSLVDLPADDEDDVTGRFLQFLADDLAEHPERLKAIDCAFLDRVQVLAGDISVDVEGPLAPDDE